MQPFEDKLEAARLLAWLDEDYDAELVDADRSLVQVLELALGERVHKVAHKDSPTRLRAELVAGPVSES